ncbi:hypothetical protein GFK06_23180, partial [Salmonella enterica subsp. enterica serovar Enteritidis]|uniref:hypothetical protein n=1 Tax=Salmonella enterica TaxID=28901 RepID=UPI001E34ABD4
APAQPLALADQDLAPLTVAPHPQYQQPQQPVAPQPQYQQPQHPVAPQPQYQQPQQPHHAQTKKKKMEK